MAFAPWQAGWVPPARGEGGGGCGGGDAEGRVETSVTSRSGFLQRGLGERGRAAEQPGGGDDKVGACSWVTRINSYLRDIQTVRPDVVPYSTALDPESQRFVVPELHELLTVPILVTTCASATLLCERGIPPGHFQMIVVDEAAQAFEPETLVPLALKGHGTRVVLAGGWLLGV
jgi:hypothetical protein